MIMSCDSQGHFLRIHDVVGVKMADNISVYDVLYGLTTLLLETLSRLMTKPTMWMCAQRRLRSAWASAKSDQSSLCAQWVAKDPSFLHADSKDSDQTGWMSRLIWVFAGRTVTLLVLSWGGSHWFVVWWLVSVIFRKDSSYYRPVSMIGGRFHAVLFLWSIISPLSVFPRFCSVKNVRH